MSILDKSIVTENRFVISRVLEERENGKIEYGVFWGR